MGGRQQGPVGNSNPQLEWVALALADGGCGGPWHRALASGSCGVPASAGCLRASRPFFMQLNHYNLFGSGYMGDCERLLARLAKKLS